MRQGNLRERKCERCQSSNRIMERLLTAGVKTSAVVDILKTQVPSRHAVGCGCESLFGLEVSKGVSWISDGWRPRLMHWGRFLCLLMKESHSQHGCCRGATPREAASSGSTQEVGVEWALAPSCFRLTGYGRILYTYSVPDQPRQQVVDRAHQRGSRSRVSFIGQVDEGREWELRIRAYR